MTINLTPNAEENMAAMGLDAQGNPLPKAPPADPAKNFRYVDEAGNIKTGEPAGFSEADSAKIREDTRRRFQAAIDAVDVEYANLARSATVDGMQRLGSQRAMQARGGILDSNMGLAQVDQLNSKNADIQTQISAERVAKLSDILNKVEDKATAEIKMQREAAVGRADDYIKYIKDNQDETREELKTLVSSPEFNVGALGKDKLDQYFRLSGFETREAFDAFLIANRPESEKLGSQKVGNKMVFFFKEKDGTISKQELELPEGAQDDVEYKMQQLDDGTVIYTPNKIDPTKPLDAQILQYGKKGAYAKPKDPSDKSQTEKTKEAVSSMSTELNQLVGADTYLTPEDYRSARREWVTQGYSSKDFDENFGDYRNPDKDYGVYK